MSARITTGNAAADGAPFGGWFVGDLAAWSRARERAMDAASTGLRSTTALEVKWSGHAAGAPRPDGWAPATPTVTLSILISGSFALTFRTAPDEEETEVTLRAPGDYALWGSDVEHVWRALSDAVIMTVRWPAPAS